MNLSLFDVPTLAPAAAQEPVYTNVHSGTDVLRRIEHKSGPFRKLREMTAAERADSRTPAAALVDREFQFVQLRDGRYFAEFTDRQRVTAPRWVPGPFFEDALRYGTYVEVSA